MKRLPFLLLVCLLATVLRAAVTGTVVTPDGTAVAGARVVAFRPLPPDEERKLAAAVTRREELASATTDGERKFSLDTRVAAVLELLVERDGFAPASDYALAGSEEPLLVELTPAVKTHRPRHRRREAGQGRRGGRHQRLVRALVDGDRRRRTYSIADPPPWAAEIVVVHPDYAPVVLEAKSGKLDAALAAGSSVSGKVMRAGGKPAASARVTAGHWSETKSGEDGAFMLRHAVENGIRDYSTGHYVTGTSTFDIRIEWDEIEGRVLDEDGTPLEGAEIGLVTADGNAAGETESDAAGEFALPAARGAHVLTVTRSGFATVVRRIEASGRS